ncbi:4Fe-4S dicluster domain-containing protein [bacterium]|nr:4Fe-4S dicluster domain-containing protein [bacterium]
MRTIERMGFDGLLDALKAWGYTLIGSRVAQSAVTWGEIDSSADLPAGCHDEQAGGRYRISRNGRAALFDYAAGPQSLKKYFFPAQRQLWRVERGRNGSPRKIIPGDLTTPKLAFIGVRPCELAAIAVQDRTFLNGRYVDPYYKAQRENSLLVAVNCTNPSGTCFCASMKTGPKATEGFDIVLTEVFEGDRHYFVADGGSEEGRNVLAQVTSNTSSDHEIAAARRVSESAAKRMGRQLDTTQIKELLYRNDEHPRWDDVEERCLSCGNCTLACPTCFCHTVEDVSDLDGQAASRVRRWDSCFSIDFSYIHGGSVRTSGRARYRQWITHKLAAWNDQFGTSGCVGCGRCITWCPVGIDITEEVRAIRETEPPRSRVKSHGKK